MGNSPAHRCTSIDDINGILEGKRGPLYETEAICLYKQFASVLQELNYHNHKNCVHHQTECPNISQLRTHTLVTSYKKIGYLSGDIIAFRVAKVPIPFILFQHDNPKFKSASTTVKDIYEKKKKVSKQIYERLLQEDIMLIKVVLSDKRSDDTFHWVIDVVSGS